MSAPANPPANPPADPPTDPPTNPPTDPPTGNDDEANWTRLGGMIESAVDKAVEKKWPTATPPSTRTNNSEKTSNWWEKLITGK